MTRVPRRIVHGWERRRFVACVALIAGSIAIDPPGLDAQLAAGLVSGASPAGSTPGETSTRIVPVASSREATATNPRPARPDPGPTAARDLPRGITLTETDIVRRGDPALAATDGDGVGEGWVTRRLIAAGEPLRRPAVAPPVWVATGESVQVLYRVGSVEARLRGTAMGTAAKDERVLVRIDTRRRVEGVVVAPGLVTFQGEIR